MDYKKYIDLGFKRYDLDDQVEFNRTGYGGFSLSIDIDNRISICVTSDSLDKPKMYIKRKNKDTYDILDITTDMVENILYKDFDYTKAC